MVEKADGPNDGTGLKKVGEGVDDKGEKVETYASGTLSGGRSGVQQIVVPASGKWGGVEGVAKIKALMDDAARRGESGR